MNRITLFFFVYILIGILISCNNDDTEKKPAKPAEKPKESIVFPDFNPDSAYYFIDHQVAFGPRVPNTPAHQACAEFLLGKMKNYTDTAFFQEFKARAFDGTILNGKNIISSINPEKQHRVLLCAHWDTRPFADYDPDKDNFNTPIDGANDGASGVGVLLEIARLMDQAPPKIGIDFIFFDAEDYGEPHGENYTGMEDTWALGAQYWARNPHQYDYMVKYGILLDMVGAKGAVFPMEYYSLQYAPHIVKKVWEYGKQLGYGNYFVSRQGSRIQDDHYYLNMIAGIPVINIIHLDEQSANGSFFDHWHTVNDNMEAIDKKTLEVVGKTLMHTLYNEK